MAARDQTTGDIPEEEEEQPSSSSRLCHDASLHESDQQGFQRKERNRSGESSSFRTQEVEQTGKSEVLNRLTTSVRVETSGEEVVLTVMVTNYDV